MPYVTGHPLALTDEIVNYVAEQDPYTYLSRAQPILDFIHLNNLEINDATLECVIAAALYCGENGIGLR